MSDTKKIILICICCILGVTGIIWLFIPKSKTIYVNELYWKYTIDFETLETHYEDGWNVPFDGEVYDRDWRFHEYEHKLVGYDEDGDPEYEDVEVYDYYYYYTVKRWDVTRTEVTKGTISEEPYWGSSECKNKERLGSKHEEYSVSASINENMKTYTTSYDIWERLQRKEPNKVKIYFGRITELE